ncbi:hypothetical protein R84981_000949 [Carnimonas sp. R-84981]|uniref:DUF2303 family protein n=1 Tax=Carnimonas bestiolae TaxID=3402172 RepID=UPI003EDBB5CD
MDSQAIQKIEDLVHAAQIGNPGTDTPTMLVPEGYRLQSLEPYQASPSRFHGRFSTSSIEDFATYVTGEDYARVFVDVDNMLAKAFFNLGYPQNPGHGDHIAVIAAERTPGYDAVLFAHENQFNQRGLANWIDDWHHSIAGEDSNGKNLTAAQLANAVRKIEIKSRSERTHEDSDWKTSAQGLDELDASAGDSTPSIIRFTCQPYKELPIRDFELQVSIIADDDKPKLKLRVKALEYHKEQIAQDFKEVLAKALGNDVPLLLGTFKH